MALTPFGKAVRRIRLDRDLLLKNMADGLGISPAFLSSIESGRKGIPSGFVTRVREAFSLTSDELHMLMDAEVQTAREARLSLGNSPTQLRGEVASLLARQFSDLSDEKLVDIKEILDRRKA